jgi:hypothetical protein
MLLATSHYMFFITICHITNKKGELYDPVSMVDFRQMLDEIDKAKRLDLFCSSLFKTNNRIT